MKKFLALYVILLLAISASAFAAAEDIVTGSQQPDTAGAPENTNKPIDAGSDNSSMTGPGDQLNNNQQTQNQGENQQLMIQERVQISEQERIGLQATIRQMQEEMNRQQVGLSRENPKQAAVLKNQNKVGLAVHALLAMEGYTGGIGKDVSTVAKDFNNSLQATIQAEEQIENKGAISRLFTGGSQEAAKVLEGEVTQNQIRIQELKQLKEQCQCDEEVKAMMQEQIQSMEQEQVRLQALADKEQRSKGLIGWMWK